MSSEAQALAVLKCPRCGAAVAVAAEPHTGCAYCRAEVEVPEAYRTALLVAAREVKADDLTRRAFATLGRPPSVALRVIDFFTTDVAPIIGTVFLTVAGTVHCANGSSITARSGFESTPGIGFRLPSRICSSGARPSRCYSRCSRSARSGVGT